MPLSTFHLIALAPDISIAEYLAHFKLALSSLSTPVEPLIVARVIRWIIVPEKLSSTRLLDTAWDLLLVLPTANTSSPQATANPSATLLPESCLHSDRVAHHWFLTAGIPSRVLSDFGARNAKLLNPAPGSVPALTGSLDQPLVASSSQNLEISPSLLEWCHNPRPMPANTAVSMLNLLSFPPATSSPDAHAEYQKYGAAFGESIGSRRGGVAKLVGKVVPDPANAFHTDHDRHGWDEVALAHYPSSMHFADMLASRDYQAINQKHRVKALRDTCILCTCEIGVEDGRGARTGQPVPRDAIKSKEGAKL